MDVEERGRVLNIRPRTPIDQNVITPISEEGKNINAIEIPVSIPRVNFSNVKVSEDCLLILEIIKRMTLPTVKTQRLSIQQRSTLVLVNRSFLL